ncbi:MAG: S8 family serine peptidase [Candidatus Bathyarchaeia archaeon]
MVSKKEKITAIIIIGLVLLAAVLWYLGVWGYIISKPPEQKIHEEIRNVKPGLIIEVFVLLGSPPNPIIIEQLKESGLSVSRISGNYVYGEIESSKLEALAEIPQVISIGVEPKFHMPSTDPKLSLIKEKTGSKDLDVSGKGVNVAVIDDGVDCADANLPGNGSCVNHWSDGVQGHGQSVAIIMRTIAPDANIISYDVCGITCNHTKIINAVDKAIENNVDIIQMSLGAPTANENAEINQKIIEAINAPNNIIASIAAGNCGPKPSDACCLLWVKNNETNRTECNSWFEGIESPGRVPDAITTGSVTPSNGYKIAGFSSRGPVNWDIQTIIKPDVVAIGGDWGVECEDCKTDYGPIYSSFPGTSAAAPQTSGVIALMIESNRALSPSNVQNILHTTSMDLGDTGADNDYGYGLIRASEAVTKARTFGILIALPNLFR